MTPYQRDAAISSLRVHLQHSLDALSSLALPYWPFYRIAATKLLQLSAPDRMSPSTRNSFFRHAFHFFGLEWLSDPGRRAPTIPFDETYLDLAFAKLEAIAEVALVEDAVSGSLIKGRIAKLGAERKHKKRIKVYGMNVAGSSALLEAEKAEVERMANQRLIEALAATMEEGEDGDSEKG